MTILIVSKLLDKTIENNNQQVVINEAFAERLQNLTEITSQISNVINYILQDKKEIKLAFNKLAQYNILFVSIEEALEFANIKILYNQGKLLYIIVIPLTRTKEYTNIIIKPIKRNNKIINVKLKEIMKNSNQIFGISDKCSTINHIKKFRNNQLVDISNVTCIPPLLSGTNSSGPIAYGYHIPQIELVSPGVILLNDFKGTINNEIFNGTYLIKFYNLTLKINNKLYRNLEATILEVSPPLIQQMPIEDEFVSLLSLEMLNHTQINNIKIIQELKLDSAITKYSIYSLFIIFAICLY